jgi:hypothetical protein
VSNTICHEIMRQPLHVGKNYNLRKWKPVCHFDKLLQETRLMSRSMEGVRPANKHVKTVLHGGRSVLCLLGNT